MIVRIHLLRVVRGCVYEYAFAQKIHRSAIYFMKEGRCREYNLLTRLHVFIAYSCVFSVTEGNEKMHEHLHVCMCVHACVK